MITRLKQALVLTPGIYLLVIWMLVISDTTLLETMGVYKLALWGLLVSFGSAYSIALFFSIVRDD
jgi:hypothetical protein